MVEQVVAMVMDRGRFPDADGHGPFQFNTWFQLAWRLFLNSARFYGVQLGLVLWRMGKAVVTAIIQQA